MTQSLRDVLLLLAVAALASSQDSIVQRLPSMADREVVQMTRAIVDYGPVAGEQGDDLTVLARARSPLVLPILEAKIEEVLTSENPARCFTNNSIDPQRAVDLLSYTIAHPGNVEALREASKLLKIDEKRFDEIVARAMDSAMAGGRHFKVLYQGFDLHDEALDKRLTAWADEVLAKELPLVGLDGYEPGVRRKWAAALVDRYGGVPTGAEWDTDPLVSRLRPETTAKLYYDIHRFAAEETAKRAKRER
jgi:hypothetical protein